MSACFRKAGDCIVILFDSSRAECLEATRVASKARYDVCISAGREGATYLVSRVSQGFYLFDGRFLSIFYNQLVAQKGLDGSKCRSPTMSRKGVTKSSIGPKEVS